MQYDAGAMESTGPTAHWPAPEAQDKREPEIPHQLNQLMKAVEVLNRNVMALCERLISVTSEEDQAAPNDVMVEPPVASGIGSQIVKARQLISHMDRTVARLLNRLEV